MSKQVIVHTNKIVIETNFYGEKKTTFSTVLGCEKIVFVNDEAVYKEWHKMPQYKSDGSIGVALNEFEKHFLFRKQSNTTKQSCGNRRNFIQRIKFVGSYLLFKIVNFKT